MGQLRAAEEDPGTDGCVDFIGSIKLLESNWRRREKKMQDKNIYSSSSYEKMRMSGCSWW